MRRGPTTWCKAAWFAPSPSSICGSRGPICGPGFSRHNQHVNDVRRAVREGTMVPVEEVAPALTADSNAGASLQLRDLERAIARLPDEQRQVILLVGLEGMRYEQVATILGIPIGTVRSRLSRGRDMLRELMNIRDDTADIG